MSELDLLASGFVLFWLLEFELPVLSPLLEPVPPGEVEPPLLPPVVLLLLPLGFLVLPGLLFISEPVFPEPGVLIVPPEAPVP